MCCLNTVLEYVHKVLLGMYLIYDSPSLGHQGSTRLRFPTCSSWTGSPGDSDRVRLVAPSSPWLVRIVPDVPPILSSLTFLATRQPFSSLAATPLRYEATVSCLSLSWS